MAWHWDCGNMWPSSRDMLGGPGHPPPEEVVRTQEIVIEVAIIPHPTPWAAALEGGSPSTSSSFLRGLDPTSISVYHKGLLSLNGSSSRDLPYDSSVHVSALPFFSEMALSHPHLRASDCRGTRLLHAVSQSVASRGNRAHCLSGLLPAGYWSQREEAIATLSLVVF